MGRRPKAEPISLFNCMLSRARGGSLDALGQLFESCRAWLLNVAQIGQVHLFYLATLKDTEFAPGPETIEARLFREDEIPWEQLAFRTVRETLHRYFDDRRRGQFGVHFADIV